MNVPTYRLGKVFKDYFFLTLLAIVPAVVLFIISMLIGLDNGIIVSYLLLIVPVVYLTLLFMRIKSKKISYDVGVLTRSTKSLYYLNSTKRLMTLESFEQYNGKKVKIWYLNGFNIILEVSPVQEKKRHR